MALQTEHLEVANKVNTGGKFLWDGDLSVLHSQTAQEGLALGLRCGGMM